MQAAGALIDQRRQRPEVGVQQLRQLTPLLDHRDELVIATNRAQHACVRRVPGLSLAAGRQLELLEQNARDLLRRAEHELLTRELIRAGLELGDTLREPRGDLAHAVRVDLDAGALHVGEHAGERQLDVAVEARQLALLEPVEQRCDEAARQLGCANERIGLLFCGRRRNELDPVLRARGRRARMTPGQARSGTRRAACRRRHRRRVTWHRERQFPFHGGCRVGAE